MDVFAERSWRDLKIRIKKAAVIGLLLAGTVYFFYPSPMDRYEIRRDHKDRWFLDTEANFVIETDGRTLEWNKEYIWSYGKSGFAVVSVNKGTIKFIFDENTNPFRMRLIRGRMAGAPDYVSIVSYDELTEEEKTMYHLLKNTTGKDYSF